MPEYKYEVGDRVHLNDTAFKSLPKEMLKHLPRTYQTTIFTVAQRTDAGGINQYFIPGYNWQGGSGWIKEEWISRWCGSGPFKLTVTVMPENETLEELREFTEQAERDIRNAMRVPADILGGVTFKYAKEPTRELDKVAGD